MSTHSPQTNDDPFAARSDEELAAALSDVGNSWIAQELMVQNDDLTLGQAMHKVENNRKKMAVEVMRGMQ